ncbi:MAG: YqgE/AlgH family protein [Rickettsiales bacterium]
MTTSREITYQYGDNLKGKMLVASPLMKDETFKRTVIYICEHNERGAMGLVLNRQLKSVTCGDILEQLKEKRPASALIADMPVFMGGPMDAHRGFVLHSSEYTSKHTIGISDAVALTSSVDILELIAEGKGPHSNMIVLGYAGWKPGQLEEEIGEYSWLVSSPPEAQMLFSDKEEDKWRAASQYLGISPEFFLEPVAAPC